MAAILAAGVVIAAGCNPQRAQLAAFNAHFERGDYERAAAYAEKRVKKRASPSGEDLLWAMQLGSVERLRGNYEASDNAFDRCEDMLKGYDEQWKATDAIGTTAVNDNILPYRGEAYDGVMVNTYKALNFMLESKMDLARVELNRALDRQRRAKEKFNEEIRKVQAKMDKNQQGNQYNVQSTIEDPNTLAAITEKYPNLFAFRAYPDFVNPFATYLAGIYSYAAGDYGKAADLLKETYGMVSDNPYIAEDLAAIEKALDSRQKPPATIWVIFENGLGPTKNEQRFDLPWYGPRNEMHYFGIALPVLSPRYNACYNLAVEADGRQYQTRVVADMDRVIQTEFKKDFKAILARTIVSSAAKTAAQYAVRNDDNPWASLLVSIYQAATTTADVRIWTALPKEFQVARLQRPQGQKITITPADGKSFDIGVPDCHNSIIYVKIVSRETSPVWEVICFANNSGLN